MHYQSRVAYERGKRAGLLAGDGRAGDGEAQHQRWESGARSCYAHAYEIACNLLEDLRLRAVRLGNHDGRAAV